MARKIFNRVITPLICAAVFVLTLSFSGTLQNASPGPVIQSVVSELTSIRESAGPVVQQPDGASAKEIVSNALARLDALSARVESETRLNPAFKQKLLADIHREWIWWRSLVDGSGRPRGNAQRPLRDPR